MLHGEKNIEIFPIPIFAKLTYFRILVICSVLYSDDGTDFTDSHHTVSIKLSEF